MFDIGAWPSQIPPRGPHINPVKIYFHPIEIKLNTGALENNITKETYRAILQSDK